MKENNIDPNELYKKVQVGDYDKLETAVEKGVKDGKLNSKLGGRILEMAAEKLEKEKKGEPDEKVTNLKTKAMLFKDRDETKEFVKKRDEKREKDQKDEANQRTLDTILTPDAQERVKKHNPSLLEQFKTGMSKVGNALIPSASATPLEEGLVDPRITDVSTGLPQNVVEANPGSNVITPRGDLTAPKNLYQLPTDQNFNQSPVINESRGAIQEINPTQTNIQQIPQEQAQEVQEVQEQQIPIEVMDNQTQMQNSMSRLGEIEAERAAREAKLLEAQQREMDRIESQRKQQEDEHKKAYEEVENEYKQITEEVGSKGIDQGRLWANMSTGNKILFSLATIIGGGLAGMRGEKFGAADILSNAIDRDIESQKQDIQNLKDKAGAKKSLMSEMYQKFGDINKAADYTKLAMLQSTRNQLDILAAKAGSQTAIEKANLQAAQLDEQINMQKQKIAGKRTQDIDMQLAVEGKLDPTLMSPELLKRNTPYGLANDPEGAKKVRDTAAIHEDITSIINDMKALRKAKGREVLDRQSVAAGQTYGNTLLLKMKDMYKLGVLSKSDEAILDKILPRDPLSTTTNDSTIEAMLNTVQKMADKSKEGIMKQNLMKPPATKEQQKKELGFKPKGQ
jgi:hypothetical protein